VDNVITLTLAKRKKPGEERDEGLLSTIQDLLDSNESLARAVGDVAARFYAVDATAARVSSEPLCRHYIDSVLEQDRQRLINAMHEVLDATLEYTKGLGCRLRLARERPASLVEGQRPRAP
jgi:hypothetical protein